MRPSAALLLLLPAVLAGQATTLDHGRLDSAWFGPDAVFMPSKALGYQWLRPGLLLQHRSLRLKAWEPAAWLLGKRATKDEVLVGRFEGTLVSDLAKGLKRGLKGSVPVSLTEGDVLLVGRVVDAVGEADDGLSFGGVSLSFDLKLVDGDTGDLLGAFHTTLSGSNPDALSILYAQWCQDLGRLLLVSASPIVPAAAAAVARPVLAPPPPAFDLEGALRRIEGLKRDGLLSEAESQVLRKKAADRAK
jgi:hypothetical protein